MAQKNLPTLAVPAGAPAGVHISGILVAKHALARTFSNDLSTSSAATIELNAATGLVRILALNYPVLVRFNEAEGDDVSASNFDDVIAAGESRDYALDESVEEISLLSIGTAADVYVVEY